MARGEFEKLREAAGKSGFHGFRAFSRLLAHKVVKMSVVDPIAIDDQGVTSLLESLQYVPSPYVQLLARSASS